MMLFVLFVRFLTLPGSIAGLIHFYTPTWKFLADLTVIVVFCCLIWILFFLEKFVNFIH